EGLEKVISARQLNYVERKVKKSAGWALALASLMPPPFPFTPFVVGASAFQYPRKKMFTVIVASRLIRFFAIGAVATVFGEGILRLAESPTIRVAILGLFVVCLTGSVFSILSWIRRAKQGPAPT